MRNLIIFILLIVVLYYAASSSPWWPRIQNRSFVFIDSVIGQKILSKYVVEEEQASVKIELPEGDLAKNPSIPIQKSNPVVPKSAPAAYKPPSQAAIQENAPVVAVEHAAFNLNQITHVGTGVFSVTEQRS
jgi:hypothetical protein